LLCKGDIGKKGEIMIKPVQTKTAPGNIFLTDAQLKSEIQKCEYCAEKPCKVACPCDCSPFDFIMAAKVENPSDIKRATALILSKNPIGGICGSVCPDWHCMEACVHEKFDSPVKIPAVQATIIAKARAMGVMPKFARPKLNGKRVAIIGAGPAGLGAAIVLAQRGYRVDIFESERTAGGMCSCIPAHRLPETVLKSDLRFVFSMDYIKLYAGRKITDPRKLLKKGYGAVVIAAGLWAPVRMGVPNEDRAIPGIDFLKNPSRYRLSGRVAVIGGGASALDCAVTAKRRGVRQVEIIALESVGEMPLSETERRELLDYGIDVTGRTRVTEIKVKGRKVVGLRTVKVRLLAGKKFDLKYVRDVRGTERDRDDISQVIIAIGLKSDFPRVKDRRIFYTGDMATGPSTVVEATAAGKNTAAMVDALLTGEKMPRIKKMTKSTVEVSGYNFVPVSIETDFFGRKLSSPFLLSASPASDGYEQVKAGYEVGWPGAIIKTSFDNLPIHIPGEYMNCFNDSTWGNADNVSEHTLNRVCREIKKLIKRYPDRLTGASTGGTVTGNDMADKRSWQGNTKKLEQAGAMVVEYSLSCPQGGEGTEGDIVSQSASLTAKIIDWVMEVSDPDVPKLFKLTSAVTDIKTILREVMRVFAKYPHKKGGVTLANTFPTLVFKPGRKKEWEDGIVVGMSGEGITPVSYLCLANAGGLGVTVSGNAGPIDYRAAANFLALGTNSVQFCTAVEKYGYGIIDEFKSGLSHLMADRGIKSVAQLVGRAQPNPIRDFMDLDPEKKISTVEKDLCVSCGNCTRCPYMAITLDEDGYPQTEAEKCIGCGLCTLQCFVGALSMRTRTPRERAARKRAIKNAQ
jgi:NADPH-dependent glutamate synthase beta subunit-like oxidoreductase/dihydroorotate dehydrogenase/Pyruvate/2-oxoacid:ferredoxin oxidoreductase delta subunit